MGRKWIILSFILCMLLLCSMTVSAQDLDFDRVGSISVTLENQEENVPIAGAKLALYQVAVIVDGGNETLKYAYDEVFENAGGVFENPSMIDHLERVVENGEVQAVEAVTNTEGKVVFSDLPLGLYFVKQVGTVEGYAPVPSFCVTVPISSEDGYVYNVDASPKTEVMKLASIQIKKVWNTGKSEKAAESVTVQLLCDGSVVETATLNAENDWTIIYDNMPVSDAYSIKEVNIPKGFTATYAKSGYEFTITNTATLAQTGQLVWPIPVLGMTGLFFLFAGMIILHKTRRDDA